MEKALWELFLDTGSVWAYLGYRSAACPRTDRKDEDKWKTADKQPVLS